MKWSNFYKRTTIIHLRNSKEAKVPKEGRDKRASVAIGETMK